MSPPALLFFLLALSLKTGNSLRCLSCEGSTCEDLNTFLSEECPEQVMLCYSLSKRNNIYRSGCAYTDCSRIRAQSVDTVCRVCDQDDCLPPKFRGHLPGGIGLSIGEGASVDNSGSMMKITSVLTVVFALLLL